MQPDTSSQTRSGVLDRVALVVNSSLDIDEVLDRLVTLTLDAIPADRCSIFLLDAEGTRLLPVTYAAGGDLAALLEHPGHEQRPHFREMPPIDLASNPARLEAFSQGRALAIPDLRSSPLVPSEVASDYGARSAVVVPLVAPDQPIGVLCLDWTSVVDEIPPDYLTTAETIGAYASLAVRNARLYQRLQEKARSLEGLVGAASGLSSAPAMRELMEEACRSFGELLEAHHCSVSLIDPEHPAAIRTFGSPENSAEVERLLPPEALSEVLRRWSASTGPLVYPDRAETTNGSDEGSVVILPIVGDEGVKGFVLVGVSRSKAVDEAIDMGRALTGLLSAAIERTELGESLRSQLDRMEVLARLSEVVAATSDLSGAIRALNGLLGPRAGVELQSISVANDRLRAWIGGPALTDVEQEAVRSWRAVLGARRRRPAVRTDGDDVLVPIVHRARVQGLLRARLLHRTFDTQTEDLLTAIATACAEVLHKTALRRELNESERRLAIAGERERIAQELHDTVGQLITGLGLRLRSYAEEAPDETWRGRLEDLAEVTAEGSRQIRDSVSSLLFFQVRSQDLVESLEELARTFQQTSGITASFEVRGRRGWIHPSREDALFRAAHEALTNVQRHARSPSVSMTLTFGPEEARLGVRDGGPGLRGRDPFQPKPGHFGLRGIRRRLEEVGGELLVADAHPRGALVEARVRLGRRRAHDAGSGRSR